MIKVLCLSCYERFASVPRGEQVTVAALQLAVSSAHYMQCAVPSLRVGRLCSSVRTALMRL